MIRYSDINFHLFFGAFLMTQRTASSSLKVLKAAQSTLFKMAFVSISLLALGSVSAYAEQVSQKVSVKKIYHFAGYGDAVYSTGDRGNPVIYSEVLPMGPGWTGGEFSNSLVMSTCPLDKYTCDVKLGTVVHVPMEVQNLAKLIWALEAGAEDEADRLPPEDFPPLKR
jgi:hypothetical protein